MRNIIERDSFGGWHEHLVVDNGAGRHTYCGENCSAWPQFPRAALPRVAAIAKEVKSCYGCRVREPINEAEPAVRHKWVEKGGLLPTYYDAGAILINRRIQIEHRPRIAYEVRAVLNGSGDYIPF